MKIIENRKYIDDIDLVSELDLPWQKLQDKSVLISGATGLIGSFLIDVLCKKNDEGLNCTIYALGRDEIKAQSRFSYCWDYISFIPYDINKPLVRDELGTVNFVIHLASNTHPLSYATDPIGTITTNIIGTQNMLEFALSHKAERSLFASSNEIYGENRGDVELFDEKYCGYIDSNTMRAGYPESKRCGEALCQAYISQKKMDIVIARLTRTYGPTLQESDTKAISQFIHKGVAGEDIVLKSEGNQFYSYAYVADSVAGLLYILLNGDKGEAYNISDPSSDIKLKDLAGIVADISGKKVVFEIPDSVEASGYSRATKARLDGTKIRTLGWSPKYDIHNGLERTINILRELD